MGTPTDAGSQLLSSLGVEEASEWLSLVRDLSDMAVLAGTDVRRQRSPPSRASCSLDSKEVESLSRGGIVFDPESTKTRGSGVHLSRYKRRQDVVDVGKQKLKLY